MKKIICFFSFINILFAQQNSNSIDVQIFRSINNNQSTLQSNILEITDETLIPIAVAAPITILSYGYIEKNNSNINYGVEMASTQIISTLIRTVLKETIKRERPFKTLEKVNTGNLESATSYSFPSGHAMSAFALATTVSLNTSKIEVIVPMYLWATIVGYGRIYFGVHYPSDVLAGAISGSAIACFTHKILENEKYRFSDSIEKKFNFNGATKINLVPILIGGVKGLQLKIIF